MKLRNGILPEHWTFLSSLIHLPTTAYSLPKTFQSKIPNPYPLKPKTFSNSQPNSPAAYKKAALAKRTASSKF